MIKQLLIVTTVNNQQDNIYMYLLVWRGCELLELCTPLIF